MRWLRVFLLFLPTIFLIQCADQRPPVNPAAARASFLRPEEVIEHFRQKGQRAGLDLDRAHGEGRDRYEGGELDLRNFDSPIADQSDLPACTAFGFTATIENIGRQNRQDLYLSEDAIWNVYQKPHAGVAIMIFGALAIPESAVWEREYRAGMNAYDFLIQHGTVSTDLDAMIQFNLGAAALQDIRQAIRGASDRVRMTEVIADYVRIRGEKTFSIDRVIAQLKKGIPAYFWTTTNASWFGNTDGTILRNAAARNGIHEGHAVAITGAIVDSKYQDVGGGYLIFKNSWAESWGDHGYGYLPLDYCKRYSCGAWYVNQIQVKGRGTYRAKAAAARTQPRAPETVAEDHRSFLIGVVISEQPQYLQIDSVHSGSLAEKAGLRAGDMILQLNGQAIHAITDFNTRKMQLVREKKALELTFSRGGRSYLARIPVE